MAYTKRYEDSYLDDEQDEVDDLKKSAEELFANGQNEKAIEAWAKLVEIAEKAGDKELYYLATERMANIA